MVTFLLLLLLGASLFYTALLFRYTAQVRANCTCGAGQGKFLSIVDKPLGLVAPRRLSRRWTAEDFGKLLPMITDRET
jgi:hypothetical protein